MSDQAATAPTGGVSRPGGGPNYAARRMLVSTVLITAIVAGVVFGWRSFTGSAGDGGGAPADWDGIALVDRASGEVTVLDHDGVEQHRLVGTGGVTDVHVHGDRLALVGTTAITVTGTTADAVPTIVPIERGSVVVPVETPETLHLLVGDPAGGNLLVVDVDDGSVLDVAALAAPTVPKLFVETVQVSADGSTFAVADAAAFQTIVVGDTIDGAVFLADQPVAVGEELVATSQVVNLQADVALVDLERRTEAIVPTELPRGGVMVDDELTMVSAAGGVFHVTKGDREAERVGTVAVPAGGSVLGAHPTLLGERLVVAGTTFQAVVDLDGTTRFTTTFTEPVDVDTPRPGWRCLPVGGGDSYHSIVDLRSGEQLADLTGLSVVAAADDGCTVIAERDGVSELIDETAVVPLGRLRDAALSPDGRTVVWTTVTGRTELVTVDTEHHLGDPLELPGAPTSVAVVFLHR